MNHLDAKSTLETLARGVDPATGEVLTEQSPFNNPQVIRALFLAVKELEKWLCHVHGPGSQNW
ncbi:hypothetical protein [Paraburkholderia phosphatilytica]|uniref:hypothetical protein n=1 Tax=Paraburkholderia phosphatilytica TaxID=2282883 RepID=UPI000E489862|nr:hypothetical protein [Paraburkholderia phosphatilytica]